MQTTEAGALYAGADLHGNNVFLSLIDGGGKEVYRRRVKANLEAVNEALDSYWPRIEAMGVESTFNWYWLVDGLQAQGRDVRLGNPAKMTPYEGIKNTDAHTDARWLAEQLRLGVFPASYIYPRAVRGVRDALRRRQLFVRQRIQAMLSLEGLLVRYGIEAPGSYALKKWTVHDVEATGLEPFVQLQLRTLLGALRDSERRVKEIEASVKAFAGDRRDPGDDHSAGKRRLRAFRQRRLLRLLLPDGAEPAGEQRQEEGREQPAQREPASGLGFHRSGDVRAPLRAADAVLVRPEEAAAQRRRGPQGAGLQVGQGGLARHEWKGLRHAHALWMTGCRRDPERGLAKPLD